MALSNEAKQARKDRRLYVLRAIVRGGTFNEVGKEIGVSRSRCQSIFRQIAFRSIHPSCEYVPWPEDLSLELSNMRRMKEFWLKHADMMEQEKWFGE